MKDSKDLRQEELVEYKMPPYDKRSGPFIECGEDYGVGKRQPVGSKEVSMKGKVPVGCYSKKIGR